MRQDGASRRIGARYWRTAITEKVGAEDAPTWEGSEVARVDLVDHTFATHLVERFLQLLHRLVGDLLVQRQVQFGTVETQHTLESGHTVLAGELAASGITSGPQVALAVDQLLHVLLIAQGELRL